MIGVLPSVKHDNSLFSRELFFTGVYFFRYPITIEDYPRQGVGAARSAARTRPLERHSLPVSYGMGMMTGGRHLHTRQALALLLREPRSKEKPLAERV